MCYNFDFLKKEKNIRTLHTPVSKLKRAWWFPMPVQRFLHVELRISCKVGLFL